MGTPEIKITVGDLDAGGKQFTFPLRAAWIRGILEEHEATAAGPDGELDVRASRSGNDVVVHGTLTAALTVPCARCLTPVPLPISQALSLLFVPGKVTAPPVVGRSSDKAADKGSEKVATAKGAPEKRDRDDKKKKKRADPEEYEISAEEADTLPYDGDVLVLDDVIRDELILETPIFPLCSEDCPGMSPPPGDGAEAGQSTSSNANPQSSNGEATGEGSAEAHADIDPRLLPLLRLKNKRD